MPPFDVRNFFSVVAAPLIFNEQTQSMASLLLNVVCSFLFYRGDNLRHNIDLVNTYNGAIFVLQGKIFPS